jgi:hypothetical protein
MTVVKNNSYYTAILDIRSAFISKQLIPKFLGYAVSQKHKMIVRTEHAEILQMAIEWLSKKDPISIIIEHKDDPVFNLIGSVKNHNMVIGDLNIGKHVQVKHALKMITERYDKFSNRKELIIKHGYDTKFGSHLIRLLVECIELLETGTLQFPLRDSSLIVAIKSGDYELADLLEMSTVYEDKIRSLSLTSTIPDTQDTIQITKTCEYIHENWLKNELYSW